MLSEIQFLKGIHPGFVLERKIREQKLRKGQLALSIGEYPQTITSITKGKRDMNALLSLKLEKELGLEEGYFMVLQAYYEVKKAKEKHTFKPDTAIFRRALFWDTDIQSLDWTRQYKAIIRRVMERGNEKEKSALAEFYSKETIDKVMRKEK